MLKKLIIGNWKMNPTSQKEAKKLFNAFANKNVIICPPFPYLAFGKGKLGAQDCFYEEKGSFTGQVSPLMLKDLKVKYVIVGHSEKRALRETDEVINKKLKTALRYGLIPILCVGETGEQKKQGKAFKIIEAQVRQALKGVAKNKVGKVVIAYEPVWAISTNSAKKVCSPDTALTACLYIRKLVARIAGKKAGQGISIIYGGSVDSQTAKDYLSSDWINGLLIGANSLDIKEFTKIAKSV